MMDFNEIEKAYAMGRAYAQGLKYAKLMAKLNTVAQDTMKDGFATLVDSEGQPYVANLNPKEKERYSETGKPLSQVKKEEKTKKEQEQKEAEEKARKEAEAKKKAEEEAKLGGQPVVLGQSVYTTRNFMSDGNVKAGAFAFAPSAATTFPDNIKTEYVTNKGSSVIGFVERNFVGTGVSSEVYAKGVVLNIAIRGDYYLVAPAGTTPTKGYKVITTNATGAISFAASASTGETDTGWVVTEGGSAGDTIVISNHG